MESGDCSAGVHEIAEMVTDVRASVIQLAFATDNPSDATAAWERTLHLPVLPESSAASSALTDESSSPCVSSRLQETPSRFLMDYKRHGSVVLQRYPGNTIRDVYRCGFTGETYYDYDKGLDTKHPIVIIHFNDVYNIEPQTDGNGGISRFVTALRRFTDTNPLVLFSGDAFNPSFISTFTKGRHMVPFLNMLKIHTACVGNHDLDFGVDHFEYLAGSTQFPWLLSNIFDAYTKNRPLAGASLYRLFEWQGHRIGIIGLVEHEWVKTLAQVNEEDIVYQDYVFAANNLSRLLRSKECQLIIALTHMRAPNDERLAREAEDIDIILGGHDHDYFGVKRIGNAIVAKSGSDFREFTAITIYPGCKHQQRFPLNEAVDYYDFSIPRLTPGDRTAGAHLMPRFQDGSVLEWDCITVNAEMFPTNRHVDKLVAKYIAHLQDHMETVLGETMCPLETRFHIIRTQESNVGNWLTDIMRVNTKADFAVFNSGTIRSDCVIPPGNIRVRDLVNMLPMPYPLAVAKIRGDQLKEMLEVSVSQYPKTEGRFLQVSGFRFTFDGSRPPGNRVVSIWIQEADATVLAGHSLREITPDEEHTICTKTYLLNGKDGYSVLKDLPLVIDEDACPNLPTMVRNTFSLAAMASGSRKPRSTATLRRVDTFKATNEQPGQHNLHGMTLDHGVYKVNCSVEGRIVNIGPTTGNEKTHNAKT